MCIRQLEFYRTHTLCALSMHFQQSTAHTAALQLLVFCTAHVCLSPNNLMEAEPEIPSAAYMYKITAVVAQEELKV